MYNAESTRLLAFIYCANTVDIIYKLVVNLKKGLYCMISRPTSGGSGMAGLLSSTCQGAASLSLSLIPGGSDDTWGESEEVPEDDSAVR